MSVLFVSSEVFPFSKTGGLADVSAALPKVLSARGCAIRTLSPAYGDIAHRLSAPRRVLNLPDFAGFDGIEILAVETEGPVPHYLLSCEAAFGRLGTPYQDADGRDWPDNAHRFALLARAAAVLAATGDGGWCPEVLHCNDWHTGLAPLYCRDGGPSTVFSIHNAAFQGHFPADMMEAFDLTAHAGGELDLHGRPSMLRAGARYADRVTTVSPQFATEIMTPDFGFGLEATLHARPDRITGILNPVDAERWNPETDPLIPAGFSVGNLHGKAVCKQAVQRRAGLKQDPDAILLAVVNRITTQKMSDVVARAADDILALDHRVQIALIGEGDPALEAALAACASRSDRFAALLDYDEGTAHLFIAGADMLLHPSRFEPCGLSPIYAQRYGTIPVATRVGGHVDSIRDLSGPDGNGVLFDGDRPGDLVQGMARALAAHADSTAWRAAMARGMAPVADGASAAEGYISVYGAAIDARARRQRPAS